MNMLRNFQRTISRVSATALLLTGTLTMCYSQEKTISSEKQDFTTETIASDIEVPWGMVFLPEGDILVSDKPGKLRVIRDNKVLDAPVEGVPAVYDRGQGGLLDLELHPDYKNNGWLYISYSAPDNPSNPTGAMTYIMRAK